MERSRYLRMRLEVRYDRRVAEAVYAIDNFPDDDLFGVSSESVAWDTSRGGSGFFTETATKANDILCKYHRSATGVGFGNMGGKRGSRARPGELGYGGVQTIYREGRAKFNTTNHPQFANPGLKGAVETFLASVSPRVIQLGTEVSVRGGIHDELQVPQ